MKKKIWQQITPKTWCKGTLEDGEGAFCALGWTTEVYSNFSLEKIKEVRNQLRKYIAKKTKKNFEDVSISQWNDSKKRKFSEVKVAFKAIDA